MMMNMIGRKVIGHKAAGRAHYRVQVTASGKQPFDIRPGQFPRLRLVFKNALSSLVEQQLVPRTRHKDGILTLLSLFIPHDLQGSCNPRPEIPHHKHGPPLVVHLKRNGIATQTGQVSGSGEFRRDRQLDHRLGTIQFTGGDTDQLRALGGVNRRETWKNEKKR
jgi:hypothetical protein